MIFTKADASNSDKKFDKLNGKFNIHYTACIVSLIYLLSTRVDLSFEVHKLAKLSTNPGKVHFEGLVHLLGYIRGKNTLVLKYHADINDALVSELLRKYIIHTEKQLMDFSYSS